MNLKNLTFYLKCFGKLKVFFPGKYVDATDVLVKCLKKIKQRFVLAVMGLIAFANVYSMRVSLSVAIVDMVAKKKICDPSQIAFNICSHADSLNEAYINKSEELMSGEFTWSEETQGIILSSFFWGYVLTQLPGGLLAEKMGGKHLVGLGILSTSTLTLLTPIAIHWGSSSSIIAVRILEGLGEGVTYPAMNHMLARWAPPNERSILGTLVFSGSQLGTAFGMGLGGMVVETLGWESIFYLFGSLGIVFYVFWLMCCFNNPREHPFAHEEEVKYLEECLTLQKHTKASCTPWKAILTSVPLWGLVFAHIGLDWGYYTLLNDLPKYMNDVLHLNISMNGFLSALPYLAMWAVSIFSSWLADCLLAKHYISTTNIRKIFTTAGSLGPAAGLLTVAFISEHHRGAAVAVLTLGVGTMGAFYPGMKVNSLDLSPNFAGTLMGITNGAGNICGILSPYITGLLTTERTMEEWRTVFFISAAILIVTNIIFVMTASGETQIWNDYNSCSLKTSQELGKGLHTSAYGSFERNTED